MHVHDADAPQQPSHAQHHATEHHGPPHPDHPAAGDGGSDRSRQGGRDSDEAAGQRGGSQAGLDVLGHDDPHAGVAQEVHGDGQAAVGEGGDGQQAEVDHGGAAPGPVALLPGHPGADDADAGGLQTPDPGAGRGLHEGDHDEQRADGEHPHPHRVEIDTAAVGGHGGACAPGGVAIGAVRLFRLTCVAFPAPGGGRQVATRGPYAGQGEGDVDEEGGAPAPVVPEPADEAAAEHGPQRYRDPDDGAEEPEGASSGLTGVVLLDHAGHLRVEQP